MEHLTTETLARLVEGSPQPAERKHLEGCEACSAELAGLREQTEMLAALPEIMPPKGDWQVLEARLRSEGLVKGPGLFQKLGLARTPSWMPAAAALVVFLSGTVTGAMATNRGSADGADEVSDEVASVDEAATAVRIAEQEYITAVSNYRQMLAREGVDDVLGDPISRYAALQHLVSVSQAAVRQAPGDPFLNGFLASALAERDAAARMVSASDDNWF